MVFTVFAVKMDGIGEKIEQMLMELKVSNEVKGVSTKFGSLESKPDNFVNQRAYLSLNLGQGKKGVPIFPVYVYQEKVRVTEHDNDSNDNPV